jgi:hypothetical protein
MCIPKFTFLPCNRRVQVREKIFRRVIVTLSNISEHLLVQIGHVQLKMSLFMLRD